MAKSWTIDRIDRLILLKSLALSASEIAEHLGGVSRNAVIGKVYRLNLNPASRETAPPPPPPKPRPEPRRVDKDIPGLCKMPDCRGPAQPGRGYCAGCISKTYVGRNRRAREWNGCDTRAGW